MELRNAIRLARIRRAYRTINKCEENLSAQEFSERYRSTSSTEASPWRDASDLRLRFVTETISRIRQGFTAHNVPKAERKKWFRNLIKEDF